MEVPFFFVVVVFAILTITLVKFTNSRSSAVRHLYDSREFLLSKAEAVFFAVLSDAIGSSGHVFAKVRVADVLKTRKGISRSERASAFNAVSQKHFDFIVCRHDDFGFVLAVELDDSSHETVRAKKRDALVDRGCRSAGVPVLRVKAARTYSVGKIQHQIRVLLAESGSALTDSAGARADLT